MTTGQVSWSQDWMLWGMGLSVWVKRRGDWPECQTNKQLNKCNKQENKKHKWRRFWPERQRPQPGASLSQLACSPPSNLSLSISTFFDSNLLLKFTLLSQLLTVSHIWIWEQQVFKFAPGGGQGATIKGSCCWWRWCSCTKRLLSLYQQEGSQQVIGGVWMSWVEWV